LYNLRTDERFVLFDRCGWLTAHQCPEIRINCHPIAPVKILQGIGLLLPEGLCGGALLHQPLHGTFHCMQAGDINLK
jgi:hypothetical protein